MSFFDIDKDERDDWRRHPVTVAALAELAKLQAQKASDVLADIRHGQTHNATMLTGQVDGIGEAIELLTKEDE